MTGRLVWICDHVAGLRVYETGSYEEMSPYCWCATIVRHGSEAELQLVLRGPGAAECRVMRACLREAGFRRYWRDGRNGRKVVEL